MRRAAALALAVVSAPTAFAQGTLLDRVVTLSTLTYDLREQPLFVGVGETVLVSDAVEFGMNPEGAQNGLDVVPVMVNIDATRVEFDYSRTPPGQFVEAVFNGYVLLFETDCVLFEGARVDPTATTLPVSDDALTIEGGTLSINVAGLSFDQTSRLAVDLDVADCPLS